MKNQTGKQFPQIIAVEFDRTCFQHVNVPFSYPESSRGCRRWQLWQEGDRLQRLPDASAAPAGPLQASHVRTLSWPLKLKSSEGWPLTHRDTLCLSWIPLCTPSLCTCRYLKGTLDQYVESDYTLIYFHHGLTSENKPSFSWLRDAYREFDRK